MNPEPRQTTDPKTLLMAQPISVGPVRLKNCLTMAPMGTNYSTTDGISTDRDVAYYVERAKGGAAMIMTESMVVTANARNHRNSLCAFHDRYIPGLASLVEAIKEHDCAVFGQINHRGALLRRSVLGMEPVGPSDAINPNTGEAVRGLRREEIVAIQNDFLAAAKRLRKAGYDGVEIHAANGYLFHEFFSPRWNRRDDDYGGAIENRMRFLLETVRRLRDGLDGFPLLVRFSCTEYLDNGYPLEDVLQLAKALQAEGVDALDLSGGSNESPELSRFCIQPPSMPRRCLEPYAAKVKEAVGVPVIVAGRIVEPADAEALLRSGAADLISLGRGLISDPHWPAKALGHLHTPIRKCISCNVCFERLTSELDVCCVQNPMVGTEFEQTRFAEPQAAEGALPRPGERRKVLVLGAGIAGMEAARLIAANGHETEIWDNADEPGGQVPLALAPPHKEDVGGVWEYRIEQIRALGVPMRLGVDVTREAIAGYSPDFVVIATGARPKPFTLPGPDGAVTPLDAWAFLKSPELCPPGDSIDIVGGGMVGIELADLLQARGCHCRVIELTSTTAAGMARNNRTDLLLRLRDLGAEILTDTTIEKIDAETLTVRSGDTARRLQRSQHLCAAIGPAPSVGVGAMLREMKIEHVVAGDADRPGDFMTAIRDGAMVALSLGSAATTAGAEGIVSEKRQEMAAS